jgi:hypothetical protein
MTNICQYCSKLFEHESHLDFCDSKPVTCIYCSSEITYEVMCEHMCTCKELNRMLLHKYGNSPIRKPDDLQSAMRTIIQTMIGEKYNMSTYRRSLVFWMTNDPDITIRMFYCAKQLNFGIFDINKHKSMFYYPEICEIYDAYPQILIPDLKFINGEYLTLDVMKELHNCNKFKEWFCEETKWKNVIITDIVADNLTFQFVNEKESAKKIINEVIEMIHSHLNIYVCRMISDYIIYLQ